LGKTQKAAKLEIALEGVEGRVQQPASPVTGRRNRALSTAPRGFMMQLEALYDELAQLQGELATARHEWRVQEQALQRLQTVEARLEGSAALRKTLEGRLGELLHQKLQAQQLARENVWKASDRDVALAELQFSRALNGTEQEEQIREARERSEAASKELQAVQLQLQETELQLGDHKDTERRLEECQQLLADESDEGKRLQKALQDSNEELLKLQMRLVELQKQERRNEALETELESLQGGAQQEMMELMIQELETQMSQLQEENRILKEASGGTNG